MAVDDAEAPAQARREGEVSERAESLRAHALGLAEKHGIEVVYRGHGIAYRKDRRVTIPEIRGQVSYLVALHEIGHIVIRPEPPLRLQQEAAAWRWALDNSIVEPTLATWRSIFRSLEGYRQRQMRWASIKTAPEFDLLHREVRAIVEAGG